MPNDFSSFFHQHQNEIVAVVVGMLGAVALLALVRKAIKLFVVLVLCAAAIATWWLSRSQDVWSQIQDLLQIAQ